MWLKQYSLTLNNKTIDLAMKLLMKLSGKPIALGESKRLQSVASIHYLPQEATVLFSRPKLLLSFTVHCTRFILSESPHIYSRQIATCNALGNVQSTCVEIGSALWLPLGQHPTTVQNDSYNG